MTAFPRLSFSSPSFATRATPVAFVPARPCLEKKSVIRLSGLVDSRRRQANARRAREGKRTSFFARRFSLSFSSMPSECAFFFFGNAGLCTPASEASPTLRLL